MSNGSDDIPKGTPLSIIFPNGYLNNNNQLGTVNNSPLDGSQLWFSSTPSGRNFLYNTLPTETLHPWINDLRAMCQLLAGEITPPHHSICNECGHAYELVYQVRRQRRLASKKRAKTKRRGRISFKRK